MTGWNAFWNAYRRGAVTKATSNVSNSRKMQQQSTVSTTSTETATTARTIAPTATAATMAPTTLLSVTADAKYPEWANEWDDLLVEPSGDPWYMIASP